MQTQDLVDVLCAQRNAAQNAHAESAAQVSDLRRQLSTALNDIDQRDQEMARLHQTIAEHEAKPPTPEPTEGAN